MPGYWLAQGLGAVVAAWLLKVSAGLPSPPHRVSAGSAFWLEFGRASLLALVVLGTAGRKAKLEPGLGLAAGLTVSLRHLLTGAQAALALTGLWRGSHNEAEVEAAQGSRETAPGP